MIIGGGGDVIWEKNRINNIKNWCGTINNKIKARTERSFRKKKKLKKRRKGIGDMQSLQYFH
jgi:predicted double-glycine peptidase